MAWWLSVLAVAVTPAMPASLTCEIGSGSHRSVLQVALDEANSRATLTTALGKPQTGPATFGPHYVLVIQQIGRERIRTVINRADLTARQTGTFFGDVLYGSCRTELTSTS